MSAQSRRNQHPAQVGQCIEQLNDITHRAAGVFDFKLFDRRVFDTRTTTQQQAAGAGLRVPSTGQPVRMSESNRG